MNNIKGLTRVLAVNAVACFGEHADLEKAMEQKIKMPNIDVNAERNLLISARQIVIEKFAKKNETILSQLNPELHRFRGILKNYLDNPIN